MLEFGTDPTSAYHRQEFDPARRTILNCASGSVGRSPPTPFRGWATGTVANLDGGIKAWKEGENPVEAIQPG